jgi:hypothetical protein
MGALLALGLLAGLIGYGLRGGFSVGGERLGKVERAQLVIDARALASSYPEGVVPEPKWPESIRRLQPLRVRGSREGLYITTAECFVEESGAFIPLQPDFVGLRGGDPEYEPLGDSIFHYRIRG